MIDVMVLVGCCFYGRMVFCVVIGFVLGEFVDVLVLYGIFFFLFFLKLCI